MTALRTLACAAVLLLSATESLASEAWRIVQTTGVVKSGGAGFMPTAVQPNQALPADAWVETGTQGRVVLVRGLETIALGPHSRVQLPTQEVNGNTRVLQTLGSALYRVGKQKAPHFQVDTPYLAAVVKGTTFTVTVTDAISSVEVAEGLVEVATPDGSDSEFVRPGFSGVVTKHDTGQVVVVNSPGAPAPDVPSDSNDKPAKNDTDVKSDLSDSVKNEMTVIAAAIGEVTLDVKEVSGGLVTSVDAPAIIDSDTGGTVVEATKDEKDPVKEDKEGGGSSGPAPSVEPATEPTLSVEPTPSVIAEPSVGGGASGGGGSPGGNGPSGGDVDLGGSTGGGLGGSGGNGAGGPGNGNGGGPGSGGPGNGNGVGPGPGGPGGGQGNAGSAGGPGGRGVGPAQ